MAIGFVLLACPVASGDLIAATGGDLSRGAVIKELDVYTYIPTALSLRRSSVRSLSSGPVRRTSRKGLFRSTWSVEDMVHDARGFAIVPALGAAGGGEGEVVFSGPAYMDSAVAAGVGAPSWPGGSAVLDSHSHVLIYGDTPEFAMDVAMLLIEFSEASIEFARDFGSMLREGGGFDDWRFLSFGDWESSSRFVQKKKRRAPTTASTSKENAHKETVRRAKVIVRSAFKIVLGLVIGIVLWSFVRGL